VNVMAGFVEFLKVRRYETAPYRETRSAIIPQMVQGRSQQGNGGINVFKLSLMNCR